MKKPRFKSLELIFLIFLAISQVWYGYRYVMQYGDEGTSPTYQATPAIYQAIKYFIAAGLFMLSLALLIARSRVRVPITNANTLFLILLGSFCAYSFVIDLTMIGDESSPLGDPTFIKAFFFFPLLALLPFHYQGRNSIRKYFAVLVLYGMTYHVLYSLIQIGCYFAFGRVPSLAYLGGLVRFGGGWDDPNGFGSFLILPLLIVLSRRFVRGTVRYILLITILTLLGLTISGSGIVGALCAVLCYSALKRRFLIIFAVVAPVTIALTASASLRAMIAFAYEAKSSSIQSHIEELSIADFFQNASNLELLLGQHVVSSKNESYYLALLQTYGFVGLTWLSIILFASMANAIRKAAAAKRYGDLDGAETFMILASFVVGFCAAAAITPSFYVFPVNFYFWLSILVIWLTPVLETRSDESTSATGACSDLHVPAGLP
jgi:hypothetical protein